MESSSIKTLGRRACLCAVAAAIWMITGCQDEVSAPRDTNPPELIGFFPAQGAVAVPVRATLYARFSEPVRLDSTSVRPLRLIGSEGELAGTLALSPDATMMTLTPASALDSFSDFQLVISAGISDLAGNPTATSTEAEFTTAADFLDVGRIFTSNEASRDITVLDLDYVEVPGSPVPLGVTPLRLRAVPAEGAVYVLYQDASPSTAGGVLVLDGRTLQVVRDSGLILPPDLADLAVAEDGSLFVAAPGDGSVVVLDAATLVTTGDPLRFDHEDAEPVRVEVSDELGQLHVGLDRLAQLDVFELPSLTRRAGFPIRTHDEIRGILVAPRRLQVWVGGFSRYTIVDLVNVARTQSFSLPVSNCFGCIGRNNNIQVSHRLWAMLESPVFRRIYFLNRKDGISAVLADDLRPIHQPITGSLPAGNYTDLVQNPRNGQLVVLGVGNPRTPVELLDPFTLFAIPHGDLRVGDNANDIALLP